MTFSRAETFLSSPRIKLRVLPLWICTQHIPVPVTWMTDLSGLSAAQQHLKCRAKPAFQLRAHRAIFLTIRELSLCSLAPFFPRPKPWMNTSFSNGFFPPGWFDERFMSWCYVKAEQSKWGMECVLGDGGHMVEPLKKTFIATLLQTRTLGTVNL